MSNAIDREQLQKLREFLNPIHDKKRLAIKHHGEYNIDRYQKDIEKAAIAYTSSVLQEVLDSVMGAFDEYYALSIKEESLPEVQRHGEKWFLFNARTDVKHIVEGMIKDA